jgi:hypothetical protein
MMQQPLFFVASAPLTGKHINVSPKGHPSRTLRVINPNLVAYLDSTGSGCETISHVYENGRVTLMCNSFGATPRILRLFCKGEVAERGSRQYDELLRLFDDEEEEEDDDDGRSLNRATDVEKQPPSPSDWQTEAIRAGARSIILLHVFKVQTSCGYGVPKLDKEKKLLSESALPDMKSWTDRDTLASWAGKKRPGEILEYRVKNNVRSLDGLPGLKTARRDHREWIGAAEVGSRARRLLIAQGDSVLLGMFIMFVALLVGRIVFSVDVFQPGAI